MMGFRAALWLLGINSTAAVVVLPYQGDAYVYDDASGTGSIAGATVLNADAILSDGGGTGSINGATILTSETIYD